MSLLTKLNDSKLSGMSSKNNKAIIVPNDTFDKIDKISLFIFFKVKENRLPKIVATKVAIKEKIIA